MSDPRLDALAGVVARVGGAACWLARLATRAAVVGGIGGTALWWFTAGDRIDEWWKGTTGSILVLAVCLAAALWLLNVRVVLLELVELPERLSGVAARRSRQMRGEPQPDRPEGGVLGTMRSVRAIVSDYGDVVGAWGTVAQLVVPWFWALTAVALVAVPVILALAAVAALV